MNTFREILGTLLFVIAVILPFEMISYGFNWVYIAGSALFFVTAYIVWPSKKKGQRNDEHWLLDVLELVIELPIEITLWVFRIFTRILKDKDGIGFDF